MQARFYTAGQPSGARHETESNRRTSAQCVAGVFLRDPATGSPHIYTHQVEEDEVIEVLERPGEDRAGREGSRIALGQTAVGRYLRVVYVPDPEPGSVFVITAYEMKGKSLMAFRKRRRKKHQ